MTTVLETRPTVTPPDPASPAWEPPNRRLLVERAPAMTAYLVERGVDARETDLAVTHLWDRLVTRLLTQDHEFRDMVAGRPETERRRWAERVVDQTVALVTLFARRRDAAPLAPSAAVDVGWHAWQLYAREAEAYEVTLCGRRVYHVPADVPGVAYPPTVRPLAERAAALFAETGLVLDVELWDHDAKCNSCNTNGCAGTQWSFFDGR